MAHNGLWLQFQGLLTSESPRHTHGVQTYRQQNNTYIVLFKSKSTKRENRKFLKVKFKTKGHKLHKEIRSHWITGSGKWKEQTAVPGVVTGTCHPCTWEAEAGGSETQGHPQLHCEFEASLGYMTLCLREEGKKWLRINNKGTGKGRQAQPLEASLNSRPSERLSGKAHTAQPELNSQNPHGKGALTPALCPLTSGNSRK